MVAALALRPINVGSLTGFASLVDLADGKVIWFNATQPKSDGSSIGLPGPWMPQAGMPVTLPEADVREFGGAASVANRLLADLPL